MFVRCMFIQEGDGRTGRNRILTNNIYIVCTKLYEIISNPGHINFPRWHIKSAVHFLKCNFYSDRTKALTIIVHHGKILRGNFDKNL